MLHVGGYYIPVHITLECALHGTAYYNYIVMHILHYSAYYMKEPITLKCILHWSIHSNVQWLDQSAYCSAYYIAMHITKQPISLQPSSKHCGNKRGEGKGDLDGNGNYWLRHLTGIRGDMHAWYQIISRKVQNTLENSKTNFRDP